MSFLVWKDKRNKIFIKTSKALVKCPSVCISCDSLKGGLNIFSCISPVVFVFRRIKSSASLRSSAPNNCSAVCSVKFFIHYTVIILISQCRFETSAAKSTIAIQKRDTFLQASLPINFFILFIIVILQYLTSIYCQLESCSKYFRSFPAKHHTLKENLKIIIHGTDFFINL